MGQKLTTLATVFADVAGSTRLFDTLGDQIARDLISQCLELMSTVVDKYGGTVIKTIGDEIMFTVPTAEGAVNCCMEMQEAVTEDLPRMNPNAPADLAIRIGLHFGEAILEQGDVFGDAVNVAARMAGFAKGGQIITTGYTVNQLEEATQESTRLVDKLPVKGKTGHISIFEVIWQAEDVTRMATGVISTTTVNISLKLRYHDKEVILNAQRTAPFVMGRGRKADMIVNDTLSSREHAQIELDRGKFILTDQSTNGTYVMTPEGSAFIRRDKLPLVGKGYFSLGRDLKEDPTELVYYENES